MSEEILRALTQLFAIITKQDDGVSERERQFVIRFFEQELDHASVPEYIALYDQFSEYKKDGQGESGRVRLTSVKDSVRTLGICRKINKTLTQKQKVVVLVKLFELVGLERNYTSQRMEILKTVSDVFNIAAGEFTLIGDFVAQEDLAVLNSSDILVANADSGPAAESQRHNHLHIAGSLVFLRVRSVDMYFVKYLGDESNLLNGFIMQQGRVYLFSHGSIIKTQSGTALYYSDLVANFNDSMKTTRLAFIANIEEFRFPNGAIGLRDIVVAEGPGKLIGIMGGSGAGKTTLLNVLAGLEKPTKGSVSINGINIHEDPEKIHGVIGYVPQDDLLIEELTVYDNLYYNARLCFSDLSREELHKRVMDVLTSLGLDQRKDLRVGNPLEKTISGGQRKRLNIALELLREPAVLFLDEPTSGLSSRDSENVIDLLKELSLRGKLIFVVVHQPSSDIYKMFDKMIIMDTGGYPVYYGAPVEGVTYFKKATYQVNSNRGQCEVCGNVNPEQIFNIIEARVVDEYGQPTARRKVTPEQWNEMYKKYIPLPVSETVSEDPPKSLNLPGRLRQTLIFATRDFFTKVSNRQYLLINLLQAPLLAVLLALVVRYHGGPEDGEYIFRFNDNIPAYFLMSVIVALFMGLTVSAEEVIRDRKILKRESFLNLSWNSYILSKLVILFSLSAIQTGMFVVVGNLILGIHGMNLVFWFILFTTSCFANMLGLNISSAFNSAVTVYVLIPLLLIPQMVFSGTIFSFDKLNEWISNKARTPIIADMMASRWAYEAMAVHQFTRNDYQRQFVEYERLQADADFKATYLHDELVARVERLTEAATRNDVPTFTRELGVVRRALASEPFRDGIEDMEFEGLHKPESFRPETAGQLLDYLGRFRNHYRNVFNENIKIQELKLAHLTRNGWDAVEYKNKYFNQSLSDLVRKANTVDRIAEYEGELIQVVDPIYQSPKPRHMFDYRAPFMAPVKAFMGVEMSTLVFNLMAIWFMSVVLYITLYTEALRKLIDKLGGLSGGFGKKRSK